MSTNPTISLAEALRIWLDSHGEPDIEERLADAAKDWLGAREFADACPTCHGPVTITLHPRLSRGIVGYEEWTETEYRAI
jgi:hypothetical protein